MRGKLGEHEVNMGEHMKNDFVHLLCMTIFYKDLYVLFAAKFCNIICAFCRMQRLPQTIVATQGKTLQIK